jgi:hypothetical protein
MTGKRRLTATVREFAAACERMRDAATLARLEMVELAAAMDEDLTASLEDATAAAIQTARGMPIPEDPEAQDGG